MNSFSPPESTLRLILCKMQDEYQIVDIQLSSNLNIICVRALRSEIVDVGIESKEDRSIEPLQAYLHTGTFELIPTLGAIISP